MPPIRNRIDMLATGIKSPIGVKVSGTSLVDIERITRDIEAVAKEVPGVSSALAERLTGGRYVDIQIDRLAAALWPEHRRCAGGGIGRHRRQQYW